MIETTQEFNRIASETMDNLLLLEQSVASRSGVRLYARLVSFIIGDLKSMRDRLNLIRHEVCGQ